MTSSRFNLRVAMLIPVLLLCAAAPARAQSTIYRCEKDGRVLYTDIKAGNCKVVDTGNAGAISTPPSGPRMSGAPVQQGAPRPPAASPASFPRVDNATQRARDDDRREILEDELNAELKKLADLKRDFNNGEPERQGNEKNYAKYQERVATMRDAIGRSEKNVEALKREIANIK